MGVQFLGQDDPLEEKMATHPVFLPGESLGQRSLAGFSLWGCKELDTTERRSMHILYYQALLILFKNCYCYYYYYSLYNTEGFYSFFPIPVQAGLT